MKLELKANANDTITPHAIFSVNGPMVARTVTIAEAEWIVAACNEHEALVASNATLQAELVTARELLESSADAMRDADLALSSGELVQGQLVEAATAAAAVLGRQKWVDATAPETIALGKLRDALAAAGIPP